MKVALSEKEDIDSTWLFLEPQPTEWIASLPLVSKNWTLKMGLAARSRIGSLERQGKTFDAAFFNSIVPLSFLGEFSRRVPFILSVDTTPNLLEQYGVWYKARSPKSQGRFRQSARTFRARRIYKKAMQILAWSDIVRDSLVRDYRVAEQKVHVVPPGIDLSTWTKSIRDLPPKQMGDKKVRILFVGRDFERKGGDLVLRMAHNPLFHHCEFHIVTRNPLQTQSHNVFVHNDVGINSEQMLAMYSEADVFVMPTRADFAPTFAICEAMSMELPVISTSVGGIDKVVVDAVTGYVVPVDNEVILAERLQRLISSEDLRCGLGQKGRELVESQFDIKKSVKTVINYMKMISRTSIANQLGA